MVAGSAAIAAAILTVVGTVTLVTFLATTNATLGAINDLVTAALAFATVPIALALHPVAARASAPVATAAVAADFVGIMLAGGFSLLLVAGVTTFAGSLTQVTIGNGLIGVWLALTAALLLSAAAVPAPVAVLGILGGLGLATTSLAFPLLGEDHPVVAVAGLCSVISLVGFYASSGALFLRGEIAALSS
jgi:hypothetical protein